MGASSKKIYLHVGFHKTATTSFQLTCAENASQLQEQGFVYPIFTDLNGGRRYSNHSIPLYSAFCTKPENYHMNIRHGVQDVDAANQHYRDQLAAALDMDGDLILSAEGVSKLKVDEMTRLFDFISSGRDCEVVSLACVRSPYEYHCSSVQQRIKGGAFVDYDRLNSQLKTIDNVLSVLPDVEFFPFSDAKKHPHGPVGYILARIGVDVAVIDFCTANEGFSNFSTRMQNEINRSNPSILNGRKNPYFRRFANVDGDKFLLTEQELESLKEQLAFENAEVESRLGANFCDKSFRTSLPLDPSELTAAIEQKDAVIQRRKGLQRSSIDSIRNLAIELEQSDIAAALELMRLVAAHRKDAPLARKKIKEYESLLGMVSGDDV